MHSTHSGLDRKELPNDIQFSIQHSTYRLNLPKGAASMWILGTKAIYCRKFDAINWNPSCISAAVRGANFDSRDKSVRPSSFGSALNEKPLDLHILDTLLLFKAPIRKKALNVSNRMLSRHYNGAADDRIWGIAR